MGGMPQRMAMHRAMQPGAQQPQQFAQMYRGGAGPQGLTIRPGGQPMGDQFVGVGGPGGQMQQQGFGGPMMRQGPMVGQGMGMQPSQIMLQQVRATLLCLQFVA